jgi:hypothetical protein
MFQYISELWMNVDPKMGCNLKRLHLGAGLHVQAAAIKTSTPGSEEGFEKHGELQKDS